ncbi:hypothetical protein KPaMU14_03225 [Kocuria palustris]|nr:hypothetical protein KPaMU14_03225 [Kocuria palustris]
MRPILRTTRPREVTVKRHSCDIHSSVHSPAVGSTITATRTMPVRQLPLASTMVGTMPASTRSMPMHSAASTRNRTWQRAE